MLVTDRPYRQAMPVAAGIMELRKEVARGWHDAALVEAFIAAVEADTFRLASKLPAR